MKNCEIHQTHISIKKNTNDHENDNGDDEIRKKKSINFKCQLCFKVQLLHELKRKKRGSRPQIYQGDQHR